VVIPRAGAAISIRNSRWTASELSTLAEADRKGAHEAVVTSARTVAPSPEQMIERVLAGSSGAPAAARVFAQPLSSAVSCDQRHRDDRRMSATTSRCEHAGGLVKTRVASRRRAS